MNWEKIGWRVRVRFTRLLHQVRPKNHMDRLRASLPGRYSPLHPNGDGLQGVYLTEVPPIMAELLVRLIGPEAM
jgi:putative restriction endonuclease